ERRRPSKKARHMVAEPHGLPTVLARLVLERPGWVRGPSRGARYMNAIFVLWRRARSRAESTALPRAFRADGVGMAIARRPRGSRGASQPSLRFLIVDEVGRGDPVDRSRRDLLADQLDDG